MATTTTTSTLLFDKPVADVLDDNEWPNECCGVEGLLRDHFFCNERAQAKTNESSLSSNPDELNTDTETTEKAGSIVMKGKPAELAQIRNSLIEQCKGYKFQIVIRAPKTSEHEEMLMDEKYDEKQSMFASINAIKSTMNIENTDLKSRLVRLENQLIVKESKKHISRTCAVAGCKRKAPQKYPNNIYLCDVHKMECAKNLTGQIGDIQCNKGSEQDKKLCRELKIECQALCTSIATPDQHQSFNKKHLYPKHYFSVAMAKLLYIQQQISQSKTAEQNDGMRTLQKLVTKLMDLLIIARQNFNCQWCHIFEFILKIISILGITPSHIGAALAFVRDAVSAVWIAIVEFVKMVINFIYKVCRIIVALLSWIGRLVRDVISEYWFVAGGASVGAGIGLLLGGPLGAAAGGLIGGGLAAMFKYG